MSDGQGTGEGTGTGAPTGEHPAWLDQMPADLKTNELFTGFKTIGDFGKSYLELQGKASEVDGLQDRIKNAIFRPGEQATPEEIQAYQKAMDIPETPDGYEFTEVEGVEQSEEMMNWSRDAFHKAGLSKQQASQLSESFDKFVSGMVQAEQQKKDQAEQQKKYQAEQQKAAALSELKTSWGADYDKNIETTRRAFKKFGENLVEFMDNTKLPDGTLLGNHPVLTAAFFEIGKQMLEPENEGPAGRSGEPGLEPKMTYDMPSFA